MTGRPAQRGVVAGEPGKLVVPKLHCSGCGKPVPKGRRNWCSQTCVDAHLIRNNPSVARSETFKRDRGVCAACGRDTEALSLRISAWLACDWVFVKEPDRVVGSLEHQSGELFARAQNRRKIASRFGIRMEGHWAQSWVRDDGVPRISIWTLWEMDHVVPVVEGGGCGLDNLRTLCRCCHKKASRELAGRRAAQRRGA